MVADMRCVNRPTRQPPSSVMPTLGSAEEPVKLQMNLVPLYLPATISPGPDQRPSTLWKKARSRSEAEASPGVAISREPTASGRTAKGTRDFMWHPDTNGDAVGTGARPWAIMVNPSLSPAATTMAKHREARKSQRVPSPSTAALAENLVSEARMSDSPDRKSTRLNSSHVKISYAVFCLK